jgi:hypothetical protein
MELPDINPIAIQKLLQKSQATKLDAYGITTTIVSVVVFTTLLTLAVQVFKHRHEQPLKIKSPTLLTLFLIANCITVVLLMIV